MVVAELRGGKGGCASANTGRVFPGPPGRLANYLSAYALLLSGGTVVYCTMPFTETRTDGSLWPPTANKELGNPYR